MKEEFISNLQSMLREFSHVSDSVPHGVKIILQQNLWQEREPAPGKLSKKKFKNFKEFCEAATPFGLNTPFEYVLNICKPYNDVLDLIDEANRNNLGENFGAYNKDNRGLHNVQTPTPTGNTKEAGLRRLRKDRKDLHEQVLKNEISVNEAMIKAGFRKKMISMPKGQDVQRWIEVIKRDFSKSERLNISNGI